MSNCGPVAVQWKRRGYESELLGLLAAPQAFLRSHNRKIETAWITKQNTVL